MGRPLFIFPVNSDFPEKLPVTLLGYVLACHHKLVEKHRKVE